MINNTSCCPRDLTTTPAARDLTPSSDRHRHSCRHMDLHTHIKKNKGNLFKTKKALRPIPGAIRFAKYAVILGKVDLRNVFVSLGHTQILSYFYLLLILAPAFLGSELLQGRVLEFSIALGCFHPFLDDSAVGSFHVPSMSHLYTEALMTFSFPTSVHV